MSYRPRFYKDVICLPNVTVGGQHSSNFDEAPPSYQPQGQALYAVNLDTWDGGLIEVTGYNMVGRLVSETMNPDTQVQTLDAFWKITRIRNLGNRTSGSVRTVLGSKLGVRKKNLTFVKVVTEGAPDLTPVLDYTYGTFIPTLLPNTSRSYEVWYT